MSPLRGLPATAVKNPGCLTHAAPSTSGFLSLKTPPGKARPALTRQWSPTLAPLHLHPCWTGATFTPGAVGTRLSRRRLPKRASRVRSPTLDYSPVRLTLDHVPERERIAVYREVIGPEVVGLDIEPIAGVPPVADLTLRRLPGLDVISGRSGGTINSRTPALAADGNDAFALTFVDHGAWRVRVRGRELEQSAATAYLMSFADPSVATSRGLSAILSVQVPRAALAALAPRVDDLVCRPVPTDSAPIRLLRGYLEALGRETSLAAPDLRRVAAGHVLDLIALAVGATGDAAVRARGGGLAAARLQAVKADIHANLGGGELTIERLAARHRLSARQLQRLFEAEGETFSAFVLNARLARAWTLLARCRETGGGIGEIAYACGFGDLSYFNRAFRRRYGRTPSDARAAARFQGTD